MNNMTSMTKSLLGASALCALLAFAGCTQSGSNSNGGQAPPPNNPDMSGPTSSGMSAPMYLTLRGPDPAPSSGNITLDLEITVNEPIRVPVNLQVLVPPGVQLVAGQPAETLNLPQAGKLYRQYTVVSNGPLTQPVIVRANATAPSGAYGFNAERQYPAAPTTVIQPGRRPPMSRPPMPPR